MRVTQQIQDVAGAAVTGAAAGAGWLSQANDVLQLIATVVAIVVGCLTLYNHFNRTRKK